MMFVTLYDCAAEGRPSDDSASTSIARRLTFTAPLRTKLISLDMTSLTFFCKNCRKRVRICESGQSHRSDLRRNKCLIVVNELSIHRSTVGTHGFAWQVCMQEKPPSPTLSVYVRPSFSSSSGNGFGELLRFRIFFATSLRTCIASTSNPQLFSPQRNRTNPKKCAPICFIVLRPVSAQRTTPPQSTRIFCSRRGQQWIKESPTSSSQPSSSSACC